MSGEGERNFLAIVAAVIAIVFAAALTAGVVVWRRHEIATVAPTPTETLLPSPTPLEEDAGAPPPPMETAHAPSIPRPHGTVTTTPDPSPIPNADHAVARLRSGFRFCYDKGLMRDPTLAGSITIAITVAPNGDVVNVTKKSGGIDATVDECIIRRARAAFFDATPSGGTVSVPLRFVHE